MGEFKSIGSTNLFDFASSLIGARDIYGQLCKSYHSLCRVVIMDQVDAEARDLMQCEAVQKLFLVQINTDNGQQWHPSLYWKEVPREALERVLKTYSGKTLGSHSDKSGPEPKAKQKPFWAEELAHPSSIGNGVN